MGMEELLSYEGMLTFEEAFEELSGSAMIEQLEAAAAATLLQLQLEKRVKVHSVCVAFVAETCLYVCA